MNLGYSRQTYKVLFVDDEEMALKYFSKAYAQDLEILTASSAEAAWEVIEREGDSIGVVISDQRMPGESGVDLLSRLRRERPGIVRILTTAYAELDHAIEAVNSGKVYHYATKPWQLKELRGVLLRAMEFFLVQRERDMLLREKLSVLQRMVIMDRVRSFTVLAAGLTYRIRNSVAALKMFFDFAPITIRTAEGSATADWYDLWTMAQKESEGLLSSVDQMLATTIDYDDALNDELRVAERIGKVAERVSESKAFPGIRFTVDDGSPGTPVRGEAKMFDRLIEILAQRAAMLAMDSGRTDVSIRIDPAESIFGTPGVRVRFRDGSTAWGPKEVSHCFDAGGSWVQGEQLPGLGMLTAFFIAHHHGGQLLLHTEPPDGPGLELLLPFDPKAGSVPMVSPDWLERVFTNLELWEPPEAEDDPCDDSTTDYSDEAGQPSADTRPTR